MPEVYDFYTRSQEERYSYCLAHLYTNSMEIGDWVRAARKHKSLTLESLGGMLGRTKANVSHWENGLHKPSFSQILKISEITGYPIPSSIDAQQEEQKPLQWPFSEQLLNAINRLHPEALRKAENVLRLHLDMELLHSQGVAEAVNTQAAANPAHVWKEAA